MFCTANVIYDINFFLNKKLAVKLEHSNFCIKYLNECIIP